MRFHSVGQACSHHSFLPCLWSLFNHCSILLVVALLPILAPWQHSSRLFPSCLCSPAQRNVDTTPQQFIAGSTTAPVKTFSLRVGGPGSSGRTACPPCQCVLRVLGLDLRTSSNLQSVPPDPGFSGGSWRSCFRRPSLNLVLPRVPDVGAASAACLCQLSSADHRRPRESSPTSPTCLFDFLRVGRRCSSQILSWSTKVRFQSLAIVRLRTSW